VRAGRMQLNGYAAAGANQVYFIALILYLALHDKKNSVLRCVYFMFSRIMMPPGSERAQKFIIHIMQENKKQEREREGKASRGLGINDASVSHAQ